MPDKDEKKKRPAPRSIRLPDDLEAALRAEAGATGKSANAIIIDAVAAVLRRSRRRAMRRAERKLLARLLAEAAAISDRLHDIALTGARDNALPIEATQRELAEIRAALLTLMGRKP